MNQKNFNFLINDQPQEALKYQKIVNLAGPLSQESHAQN
jgi:hypothetical protein